MRRADIPVIGPQAARLLTWLTTAQLEIAPGDKWPSWALSDFIRPPIERPEKRQYKLYLFLVSNGLSPDRAAEFMTIEDWRNGILHYGGLRDDQAYALKRLTRRAKDGTLYKNATRMQDMTLGRPIKPDTLE
jgi:hypothetical protein